MDRSTVSAVDIELLRRWVGTVDVDHDVASVRQARLLAATLDLDPDSVGHTSHLPPLWHWIYFLTGRRPGELGRDGHAARGMLLPPVPLPIRMWAGGRVKLERVIPLNSSIEKRSTVQRIDPKRGRSGDLVFVTVEHQIFVDGQLAIKDEQDLVYRSGKLKSQGGSAAPFDRADCVKVFTPTSTTLFRYSALTFNGHRIHYDLAYCHEVEKYENLVVHGPLIATLLADLSWSLTDKPLHFFEYRGVSPAVLGHDLKLHARHRETGLDLWATSGSSDNVVMTAKAEVA